MARLRQIVVDACEPAELARFWAAALDGFEIRPYDDAEVARLAAIGRTPANDPVVVLNGPHGLEVCFQQVDVQPVPKKPLHLDLDSDDRESDAARLVALGASIVQRFEGHIWLRDPEGNDFCLTDGRHGDGT